MRSSARQRGTQVAHDTPIARASAQASATREHEGHADWYADEDEGQVETHTERKGHGRGREPQPGSPSTASPEPETGDHVGGTDPDEDPAKGREGLRSELFERAGHRPEPESHRQLAMAIEMRQHEGHRGAERNTDRNAATRTVSGRRTCVESLVPVTGVPS